MLLQNSSVHFRRQGTVPPYRLIQRACLHLTKQVVTYKGLCLSELVSLEGATLPCHLSDFRWIWITAPLYFRKVALNFPRNSCAAIQSVLLPNNLDKVQIPLFKIGGVMCSAVHWCSNLPVRQSYWVPEYCNILYWIFTTEYWNTEYPSLVAFWKCGQHKHKQIKMHKREILEIFLMCNY